MLEKEQKYTSIDLSEGGEVSLRLTTTITDNGVVISKSHHREVRLLEDSLDDLPEHISGSIAIYRTGIPVIEVTGSVDPGE
jgi:hypothetical protein